MRLGPYDFSPALWPTLVTLALLPCLAGLGFWQLERATWKQELVDMHAERMRQPVVGLEALQASGESPQYRRVSTRGRYDLEHQLLLDNRTWHGRAGYHVLTPLRLAEDQGMVLVNRGWVPVGASRAVLPDLPGPAESLTVRAMVALPPEKTIRLDAAEEAHSGWPQVVQQIDLARLQQRLGVELLPYILLLDEQDEHGFAREWKAVYGVTPDKHRAYAMQWFTLAMVLLLIYLGVNMHRIPHDGNDINQT